ncbi:acyltransferase family protein [Actinomycetaceae bacterium L2_0104]
MSATPPQSTRYGEGAKHRRETQDNTGNGPSTVERSPQRLDIQGLRALCMAQVLLFHAWHIGSPIGVDSFIMISAFLMTASFIRRAEAGRTPFFIERWANTFKRLLPPLIVVVFATLWASLRFLPETRWEEIFDQAKASLTYTQNWRLIEVSADYYAENSALSSPLQHLWSMSMQGQVFLLWPVIMALCVLVAKLTKRSIRLIAFLTFAAITVASLTWLLADAPSDGSVYFYTRARLWEFALGSTLAVAAPWLRLRDLPARIASWLGLGVLVTFCLVSIGSYPGPMAAIPMLAVSTILLFPSGESRFGVSRLLSRKPLVALGDISYAVYLIHWPVFVIYLNIIDQERLTLTDGLALMAVTVFLSWAVTKLVDNPLRTWPWANSSTIRKLIVALSCFAVGLGGVLLWDSTVNDRADSEEDSGGVQLDPTEHPGALALRQSVSTPFTEQPVPDPTSHWAASLPDQCEPGFPEAEFNYPKLGYCSQVGDSETASMRVLSIGNSKLSQFMPAIREIAEDNNWYVQHSHQSACPWAIDESASGPCRSRNQAALDYIDSFHPDFVLLSSTLTTPGTPDEALVTGVEELVAEITGRGIPVIGIRDTIRFPESMLECSLDNPTTSLLGGCTVFRPDHQPEENPASQLESIDGFAGVDLTDQFCFDDLCPSIIGNVYVYVDTMHVSVEYVVSLVPVLASRLQEAQDLLVEQGFSAAGSDQAEQPSDQWQPSV